MEFVEFVIGISLALILIAFVCLIAFVWYKKMKENMKEKGKKYGALKYGVGTHRYGLPNVKERASTNIFLADDKIVIEADKRTFEVTYEQLTAAEAMTATDLLTKDKSVIGRAIVGGLLLGPIGAIVGGMSGASKEKMKGNFLILNYIPSNSDETKVLIFNMGSYWSAQNLAKFIKKKMPPQPSRVQL